MLSLKIGAISGYIICCICKLYTDGLGNTVGSYRHGVRRGSAYNVKEGDGSSAVEGKSSKRGGSSGYASQEVCKLLHLNNFQTHNSVVLHAYTCSHKLQKQVWVQKSSSAT